MTKLLKKSIFYFILFALPIAISAQNDVTQFLGIPVDGTKSEMIKNLISKGFSNVSNEEGRLKGEFNGVNSHIIIATNNNLVRRIAVLDAYPSDEENIKKRFNKLLRQFQNNDKYLPTEDSSLLNYIIPEEEDISYEMLVNKKFYQAMFYQKTLAYDLLLAEQEDQNQKIGSLSSEDIIDLATRKIEELYNCFNKKVWINLNQNSSGFYITIFYDNIYNEANGDDL